MNLQAASMTAVLDEETGTVTLTWLDAPPSDDPNPAMWRPQNRITLTLPGVAVVESLAPAPPIEESTEEPLTEQPD